MNLLQTIISINEFSDEKCIFARKPWSSSSQAVVEPLGENFQVPVEITSLGLEYFLEIHIAREVLHVLGGRSVSSEEELELLIFYAENDAYPDWVYTKGE